MFERLRIWWTLDPDAERRSADNPLEPLRPEQRRDATPLLLLAFGWGFLITGLLVGGGLGAGQPFWPDLIWNATLGNIVNFVVGAAVGYVGYKTACNSALLYRLVYGNVGAWVPVLFLTVLLLFWQGIVVGAFSFAWVQTFDSPWFYAVAIFAGLLYTFTTYFGVKGLEDVALPASLILVAVLLYGGWYNVDKAGGWDEFLQMSAATAARNPMDSVTAINLVIGAWIVGAVVMPEYTRFAKSTWVALAIPFIVLIVAQIVLQIVGAMGGVVSGNADFTGYMRATGTVISMFGLIAMSFALWTTGDANLYLPAIQTASLFRRPKRVMVVVLGLIGTVIGLGIYQRFMDFVGVLANVVPPLIGPLIVDFYLFNGRRFDPALLERMPAWNPVAVIAFIGGAAASFDPPSRMAAGLYALLVSMAIYAALCFALRLAGIRVGHARAVAGTPPQSRGTLNT